MILYIAAQNVAQNATRKKIEMNKKTKATIANISRSKSKNTKRQRKQRKDEVTYYYHQWCYSRSLLPSMYSIAKKILDVEPMGEGCFKYYMAERLSNDN